MSIAPSTDREKLIAEASHLQGYEEGVRSVTERLIQMRLKALQAIDAKAAANVTPIDKTGTR
jgi:hypothetical protein